jgi:hypothetical protein
VRILSTALLLSACWSDFETESIDQVAFQNTHLAPDQAVVTTYELKLQCPDGKNARFYTVHDASLEGPLPAAVVLHSSAFDYVRDPSTEAPLVGAHFADKYEDTHRLAQDWGIMKVWETLGMHPQVESTENNTGALPAALAKAGVAAFYPINCWGDLWHNTETRTNDLATEYFPRWGGTFASWMARLANEPDFAALQGVEFDFEIADAGLHLIGLGDGARGIISILKGDTPPELAGIFVDSPVDDLSYWADGEVFTDESIGLQRIFNYSTTAPDWNSWTLRALVNQGYADGAKVAMAYSETDPRVPYPEQSFKNMVVSINAHEEGLLLASASPSHVLSNQDPIMAQQVVNFLLDRVDEPEPEPEPEPEEN